MDERDDYADGTPDSAHPFQSVLLGLAIGGLAAFVLAAGLIGFLIWFLSGLALEN